MGAGLVGEDIWDFSSSEKLREDIRAVADEADADGFLVRFGAFDSRKRFVEGRRHLIDVAGVETLLDSGWVDVNAKEDCTLHRGGEGLSATQSADSTADHQFPFQGATEVSIGGSGEGFVGALDDSLAADVDP